MLTGGTYLAPNGSVVWKGLGFSANGPYDCAFALNGNGSEVSAWPRLLQEGEVRASPVTDGYHGVGYWILHLSGPTECEHPSWRDWAVDFVLRGPADEGGMRFSISRLQVWS